MPAGARTSACGCIPVSAASPTSACPSRRKAAQRARSLALAITPPAPPLRETSPSVSHVGTRRRGDPCVNVCAAWPRASAAEDECVAEVIPSGWKSRVETNSGKGWPE
jgi:hypothetical protein